jgi:hypothetical protein
MKHVLLIDDGLFRELEEAAACKDLLLEDLAAALLRAGMEASEGGKSPRPAIWPPREVERRSNG